MGTLRARTRAGCSRGLVQAPHGWPTGEGWILVGLLAAGFTLAALLTFGLVRIVVGSWMALAASMSLRMNILSALAVIAAGLDIYSARCKRTRFCPLSLSRQTPKSLLYSSLNARFGVLLWGLDTGSVVSTFRVSAVTWIAVAAAALGIAPAWIGVLYAVGFLLPLTLVVTIPEGEGTMSGSSTLRITTALRGQLRSVQVSCAALLLMSAGVLVLP